MAKRKCYVQTRAFIPELAEILGKNPIDIEYEFDKAQILGVICVFDVDITKQQEELIKTSAAKHRNTPVSVARKGGVRNGS